MVIPFNQIWYEDALEEQKNRAPHMLTKYAQTKARKAGQIRGLVIEKHVTAWFKNKFPNQYREADNYKKWTQICDHDFKIKTNRQILYIDVSGPRKDGTFGTYAQKPKKVVDYHIIAYPMGFICWNNCDFRKGFKVIGVVSSQNYLQTIKQENILSLEQWLLKIGI